MSHSRERTAERSARAYRQHDADAALALLDQSIALGHRRIALIRFLHAQFLGAALQTHHHDYVAKVAARFSEDVLLSLTTSARQRFEQAAKAARVADNTSG